MFHEKFDSRALAELEVESTAYMVCHAPGIDSSDYSFGYGTTWASGGEQAISGIKGILRAYPRTAATSCGPSSPQHRWRRELSPCYALSQRSCILETMTDDAEPDYVGSKESDDEDEGQARSLSPEIRSALQAFQQQQRLPASFDFSAITQANKLIMEITVFLDLMRHQAEQFAVIAAKFDYLALVRQINSTFTGINWEPLLFPYRHSVRYILLLTKLIRDERLPLMWVPRFEILDNLLSASTSEDRIRILDTHVVDVMDDCEAVLNDIKHEWAIQCRCAISALREGLYPAAQSHASNIIDSIVLAIYGKQGRDHVKKRAQEGFSGHVNSEQLLFSSLSRTFIKWSPDSTDPIPDHFARHATAHAVGQPGVFSPHKALVAVMLATSLTTQFWDDSRLRRDRKT